MDHKDSAGYFVTGASADALESYEAGSGLLRIFSGDPAASAEEAIRRSPGMPMAYVLKAWLNLLGTGPAGLPVARQCLDTACDLRMNEREEGHLAAIAAVLDGRWRHAARVLQDVSAAYPLDTLALQAGHQVDFFTGDSRMLRDRIAGVLPAWSASVPGYHAALSMHAFGLEEMGDYSAAEALARRALELEPRDGWAWHAVAHVMEMQDRAKDGIQWLEKNSQTWAPESFFAVHNWWHLALFHLDQGNHDEVLRLFDGPIHGARSTVVLDMIDAAALLWRLELRGVDVGDRWNTVSAGWEPLASAGNYAFNDCHALMAFIGAGHKAATNTVIDSLHTCAAAGSGDVALFAGEVGVPFARALHAFSRADWKMAVDELRSIRSHAHRFGGSHAQRDIIDLTLIEAARQAGMTALATMLVNERAARKPNSLWTRSLAVA